MNRQHDSILTLPLPAGVMLSRSEASLCPAQQTLRFAQGDSGGADFIIQIEKLISIISFNIRFQKCSKKS
jgi:hypothetical protein